MVLGWFHCRQREKQVQMSCGKTEHGWEESQQGWFVKIWRMFYGLRWGWGHRQRKGHRKSGYWYLSWDHWEIVVEPSTGQQQKHVFKNCHGLGWKRESFVAQTIKRPPTISALLAFLSSMLCLPTRHWYLLFSLSATEPSQHHTPFYTVAKYT